MLGERNEININNNNNNNNKRRNHKYSREEDGKTDTYELPRYCSSSSF